jgi:flagellar basal body-associated protein FliL
MKFSTLNQDKGVAGLTILLSLITMLFVIGLLVMIFSLMGGKTEQATWDATSTTIVNQSKALVNETGAKLTTAGYRNPVCTAITVINSSNNRVLGTGNYSITDCVIYYKGNVAAEGFNQTRWNMTFTLDYDADTTASKAANKTAKALSGSTDFFDLFIVIGSMVVLVLLTVIIITAIRGSGLMGESSATSKASTGNIGSP